MRKQKGRKADIVSLQVLAHWNYVPERLIDWRGLRGSCYWFFPGVRIARPSPDRTSTPELRETVVVVYGRAVSSIMRSGGVPCCALWFGLSPHAPNVEGNTAECTYFVLAPICTVILMSSKYHGICQMLVILMLCHKHELDTTW